MFKSGYYVLVIFLMACTSFLENQTMQNPASIYKQEQLPLYLPFSFQIDPMERLLLVNFEKDPDSLYIGLEPQYFKDERNGYGLLVIAWRKDMKIDVYHEATLSPDPSKFDIAGNGLGSMHQVDFRRKEFEILEKGVKADIGFKDKHDREIEIFISESHPKKRKPFGLLAPMGEAATKPSAMPLVLLHDFYFVRRKHSEFYVKINRREHTLDKLPIPMDGTWMLFARYSPDPFIVTFNPNQAGPIEPVNPNGDGAVWEKNGNAMELKQLTKTGDGHQIQLTFNPAFPQFNILKEGVIINGNFEIQSDESTGKITGSYQVSRSDGKVKIQILPDGGWHPKADKLSLKFLFTVAKIFKNWPKSYEWSAVLTEEMGNWYMESQWNRL